MKLTYQGPHDSVGIEQSDGTWVDVWRGQSCDVPDDTAGDRIAAGFTTGDAKKDAKLARASLLARWPDQAEEGELAAPEEKAVAPEGDEV